MHTHETPSAALLAYYATAITRRAASPAVVEAFAALLYVINADPFAANVAGFGAFYAAAANLVTEAEAVASGKLADLTENELFGRAHRRARIGRDVATLIDFYMTASDCTGTLKTIYLAARKAASSALAGLA